MKKILSKFKIIIICFVIFILLLSISAIKSISIKCDGYTKQCVYTEKDIFKNISESSFSMYSISKLSTEKTKKRINSKSKKTTTISYYIYLRDGEKKVLTKNIYNDFSNYCKNQQGDFIAESNGFIEYLKAISIFGIVFLFIWAVARKLFE